MVKLGDGEIHRLFLCYQADTSIARQGYVSGLKGTKGVAAFCCDNPFPTTYRTRKVGKGVKEERSRMLRLLSGTRCWRGGRWLSRSVAERSILNVQGRCFRLVPTIMKPERKKIRVKRRTKTSKAKRMEKSWGGEKPAQGMIARVAKRGLYVAVALGVIAIASIAISAYKGDKKPPVAITGNEEKWIGPSQEVVAENFTKATTHEERLKWVRDPERVSATMKTFFEEGAGAKEKILGMSSMGSVMTRTYTFTRFQVRLENEENRLLAVVLENQQAKVDFECYARYGTASWEDLLSGKTSEASEMRVMLVNDEHYLFEFADEKKWKSFLITSPDTEMPMHVYAARGSETEKALTKLGLTSEKRVTIGLRAVRESYKRRQFEVTHLLAPSWVK